MTYRYNHPKVAIPASTLSHPYQGGHRPTKDLKTRTRIRIMVVNTVILMMLIPITAMAEDSLLIGDFARSGTNEAMPAYWEPLLFDGISRHTVYSRGNGENHGLIEANSDNSASGFVRKTKINLEKFPTISFSWKIQDIIDTADLTIKNGDDAPARVYITFAYDSSLVSWTERVKFEVIRIIYGEYPPIGALVYVWANSAPKETIIDSPYTDRVKNIVLESGPSKKGILIAENRDVYKDYQKAFKKEDVPVISGVALMTDTDNTGSSARAWYGNIIFSPRGIRQQ